MDEAIRNKYDRWTAFCRNETGEGKALYEELLSFTDNETAIEEAFYKDLEFGTAGLRGILGAGTNRMNIYTVALAAYGMAQFVLQYGTKTKSVAIAYDSRINSELFARTSAAVFAACGVKAWLFPRLQPTPCLSYAVRALNADAGVMITASHNPAKYNGFKAYGPDGCQMTSKSADIVYGIMEETDVLTGVPKADFEKSLSEGLIEWVPESLFDAYIAEVKNRSVLPEETKVDRNVAIVYTPLNGAGREAVMRILRETGFTNVTVVKEQEKPDGHFPTCPYPNPEMEEAMALGMEYCRKAKADLLIATDPDSDRLSIAVRSGESYRILTGNETGCLLLDYVASMRKKSGTLPEKPVAVKSIVTSELASKIASSYGIEMRTVLTGFKYIGEQILKLEEAGEEDRFVFGFEESCGFLSGTYCRDKDAVNAALLVTEMFVYYRSLGKSILDRLAELYRIHGHYLNRVKAFEYDGMEGIEKMRSIMETLRRGMSEIGEYPVTGTVDYLTGRTGLPKADVLAISLKGGASVIVRPSGTEPKIKVYVTACSESEEAAIKDVEALFAAMKAYL